MTWKHVPSHLLLRWVPAQKGSGADMWYLFVINQNKLLRHQSSFVAV